MLLINSSNVIQTVVTNPLQDPIYVNDATVNVTIYDSAGDELSGETWPQQLDYVAASDGVYRKTFAPFVNLIENENYTIKADIVGSDGLTLECNQVKKAQKASCC